MNLVEVAPPPLDMDKGYVQEYLTPQRLPEVWHALKPLVQDCVDRAAHGEYGIEHIYRDLANMKAFAFVEYFNGIPVFLVVFEIEYYDKFRAANIPILAGRDFKGVRDRLWPTIRQWLRDNNVKTVDASVSDSMYRVCKRLFGFEKVYNHIRLDIGE